VDRLRDEDRRLDELSHRGWTVRSSITLTYETLSPTAQRLFRLLALVDTPAVPTWTAAALLDTTLSDAEAVLESLVDARLLDTDASHYRLPDLVRLYAKELPTAPTDDSALCRADAHRDEYGDEYGDHRARESLHTVLRTVRAAADRIGETHALYALGMLRHQEGRDNHLDGSPVPGTTCTRTPDRSQIPPRSG
jgi:hypothetical protein